jgi:hypothetical protein
MLTIHEISTGLQAWVAHAEAKMTLQAQEIQSLKDENEALRLTISPHPFVPVAPTPVRVVTEIEIEGEPE